MTSTQDKTSFSRQIFTGDAFHNWLCRPSEENYSLEAGNTRLDV